MRSQKVVGSVRFNVEEALNAICAHGKGRCWYCDARLPSAKRAIRTGWDVRRVEEQPVASIILVCPSCSAKGRRRRTSLQRGFALGT